ncbi:MarC family protein [Chloroflexota bacterium]
MSQNSSRSCRSDRRWLSTLANNHIDTVALSVAVMISCVIIWATHLSAPVIVAHLRPLGRLILNRLCGIILATIAVQLFASDLKGLVPVLAGDSV